MTKAVESSVCSLPSGSRRIGSIRAGALIALSLLLFPHSPCGAQAPDAAPVPAATPAPARVVYWELFKHVMFLEKQADLADTSGEDGWELRHFYQIHVDLSLGEEGILKQIARAATTQVAAIDAQAREIVMQFQAQYPGGRLPKGVAIPKPPAILGPLQKQRDQTILDQEAQFRSLLGDERFQQFDAYVQKNFAPHVTVQQIPMHPPVSTGHPLPPSSPAR